ncbi:MAG: hypothetical protein ACYCDI_07260 [Corynebacterium aurimucosum]|uniref:hypothetical protein n=1 Tax=Corynebacterium TaxID=1716 RepID=UPI000ADAF9C9|nr:MULTISPECIES: hypothetical protein [unclassified Corynebacterium]MBU5654856.1 hypothetical protein [Corynebacterium aurimucosum]
MFKPRSIIVGLALAAVTAPSAQALTFDPGKVPPRTQMTVRYADGNSVSTGNSHESRPALSLAKLYLGMWVLKYGASEDKARVENMIRFSEDGTASDLERKYPQAIPSIIGEYRLGETHHNGYWGNTTTSTEDLTRFIGAISGDPAAAPLMKGMAAVAPAASDGYRQDFGTARIPGIIGTKFGWSDNRQVHASASFGPGYSVAANTYGSPADLTGDVLGAVEVAPQAPGLPTPLQDARDRACAELKRAVPSSSQAC